MVHHANHVRENKDGVHVGGHQSSSASVVTILTALYLEYLRSGDFISIKPHASPVFHAIQYLLGHLDQDQMKGLRQFGGLQSYPSRTKDPDPVDFSTGTVGLGAVGPNFASLVAAYNETHGFGTPSSDSRFVSLVGDAELDEGAVWEAIAEPVMQGLDNLLWVVDLNRQSLDRVIPGIRVRSWREMFAANGWHVVDLKYGSRLLDAFEQPNGDLLRDCIDGLSNEAYQSLLRLPPSDLREWLPRKSRFSADLDRLLNRWSDPELHDLFGNLGGHDYGEIRKALTRLGSRIRSGGHLRLHHERLEPALHGPSAESLGAPVPGAGRGPAGVPSVFPRPKSGRDLTPPRPKALWWEMSRTGSIDPIVRKRRPSKRPSEPAFRWRIAVAAQPSSHSASS